MTIEFIPTNKGFDFRNKVTASTLDKLPAGIYAPEVCEKHALHINYYLDTLKFDLPSKFYGQHDQYKTMIRRALTIRQSSVGALLLGHKGNGKTLLMHDLCNTAIEAGHPVFVINSPLPAKALRLLYALVNGPCVFLLDEFDKVYTEAAERTALLEFFSDRNIKGALFLLAVNDRTNLPDAFIDRTGRFLFRITYGALKRDVASEILADYVLSNTQRDILLDYVDQQTLNIDTFMSLASEIEQFGEDVDLDLLFSTLNIPRPVYVVPEINLDISSKTPLPAGWRAELERLNHEDYQIVLLSDNGDRYVGSRLEIESAESGHRSEAAGETTYSSAILPYDIDVRIKMVAETKLSTRDYKPATFNVGTYSPKKKEQAA